MKPLEVLNGVESTVFDFDFDADFRDNKRKNCTSMTETDRFRCLSFFSINIYPKNRNFQ